MSFFISWFKDNWSVFVAILLALLFFVFLCVITFIPASKCNHPYVSCVDCDLYNRSSGEWHIHKARCRKCGNNIGFLTTEEMIEWNS